MRVGKYLNEKKQEVKVVGVELKKRRTIQGLKNMGESIPSKIYNPGALDEKITVEDAEPFTITRLLATKEGLLVGMSSGAVVAGRFVLQKI